MRKIFIFLVILKTNISVFGQGEAPLVTIPDGQLRGTANLTVRENITYYAYRGIPFAQKPIGDLRFAAPIKNDPWNGTLDATEDQNFCVQGELSPVIGSEDCLYINVYTTNTNGTSPVMVWIYGGAFTSGASSYDKYKPDYLLEKDVVYVSFNYRLGVFGFLSTEDDASYGNWGLKDQILALKWVKDNVKYFGGDPEKITVFGESAGSASVSYLMQSNLTTGLFNGAIMESGTSLCSWALTHNARQKAFGVGIRLGIITLSSQTLIKELRKANYKALKHSENSVTLQSRLFDNLLAGLPFGVVQEPDHPEAVFSGQSWQLLSTGNSKKIPTIVGFNSNEGAAFTPYVQLLGPVLLQYDLDVAKLAPYSLTNNRLKQLGAGAEIREHYFGKGPLIKDPKTLVRFASNDQFVRPIREFVVLSSQFSQVYYYEFSYKGLLGDPKNSLQGVAHTEEMKYLFASGNSAVDANDNRTIERFTTLWTNFAKTGNPTPPSGSGNGTVLGELTWEPNDSSTNTSSSIKFLNIDDTLVMGTNPSQPDWDFYQGIYQKFGDPPYSTY